MEFLCYAEFVKTYVPRESAKVKDIQQCLETGSKNPALSAHIKLQGPKHSGKSTTLAAAYFYCRDECGMPCKLLDLKGERPDYEIHTKTFFFVDNAQMLKHDHRVTSLLKGYAACVCFAYSSTVMSQIGLSTYNTAMAMTGKTFYLAPFTEEELAKFKTIFSDKHVPELKLPLPGLAAMAMLEPGNTQLHLFQFIHHIIANLNSKLSTDENGIAKMMDLVIAHSLGNERLLTAHDKINLILCGLAYYDLDYNIHFIFNDYVTPTVLEVLYPVVKANYQLFGQYSKGGAEELLFSHLIMSTGITVVCYGKCFSVTGKTETLSSVSLKGTRFVVQDNVDQDIRVPDESVLVIKLILDHPAIDFIVIHRRTTNSTQKMYLIQVSTQEYQQRPSEGRMNAVKDLAVDRDHPPVLHFYADKFKVLPKFVFYVYASPIIPLTSRGFTVSDANRLHFAQL